MSFWKSLFGNRMAKAIERLEDPVWEVRYDAIESLGKLKNGKAIVPILECVGRDK